MAGDRRVNLVKRYSPPRQIQVSILHATAAPLLNLALGSLDKRRAADGVATGGHRLQERRVILDQACLGV
jgi:hypothetical protein